MNSPLDWQDNMLVDDVSKNQKGEKKKGTIMHTIIIHTQSTTSSGSTCIPGPALDTLQTWSMWSKTIEGDRSLNVWDWLVKAPAMQENGMMCSYLECKKKYVYAFVYADITYDAGCSLTASNTNRLWLLPDAVKKKKRMTYSSRFRVWVWLEAHNFLHKAEKRETLKIAVESPRVFTHIH